MRMFRITNGFTEMTDPYLLVRANFIKASMTGNDRFPQPQPSLPDLGDAITAFATAAQVAEGGNRRPCLVLRSRG